MHTAIKVSISAALAAGLTFAAPSAAAQSDLSALFGGPEMPQGEELAELIEEAEARPLGSQENPVRAEMPAGQRAYLNRLRCEDGNAPTFHRVGNFGVGVFGRIIDGYEVKCENGQLEPVMVFMDMYHPGHVEARPVAGFTIDNGQPTTQPAAKPKTEPDSV